MNKTSSPGTAGGLRRDAFMRDSWTRLTSPGRCRRAAAASDCRAGTGQEQPGHPGGRFGDPLLLWEGDERGGNVVLAGHDAVDRSVLHTERKAIQRVVAQQLAEVGDGELEAGMLGTGIKREPAPRCGCERLAEAGHEVVVGPGGVGDR